jgi:hypothetical protein
MKKLYFSNPNIIKSVFLLILAIAGNFLAPTLNCKTQLYCNQYMPIKHLILICIIYFTLNFTSEAIINPFDNIKNTLYVYVAFILFTRQDIYFTIVSILLLLSVHVMDNYIRYYEEIHEDEVKIKKVHQYRENTFSILVIVIIAGFLKYLLTQYRDHNANFSLLKILFGTVKCDNYL